MPHRNSSKAKHTSQLIPSYDTTTHDLFSGRYNLTYLKKIGSGYTSTVVKCIVGGNSTHPEVVTAAKVMLKDGVKRKYFQNEVDLLRRGDSQNVVEFVMALECIDSYVIITEYCSQGDLHDKLQTLDDSHVMAREYMIGVVNGLQALHSRLIAHLDIKMKNILITSNNVPKIADFGFAVRLRSRDEMVTSANGTKDYWAPEMLTSEPSYDPIMADVYALAVTFVGVCVKKPVKRKHDNIFMIIQAFQNPHQRLLFRGMLQSSPHERWTLDLVSMNEWLHETITPPASPSYTFDQNPLALAAQQLKT